MQSLEAIQFLLNSARREKLSLDGNHVGPLSCIDCVTTVESKFFLLGDHIGSLLEHTLPCPADLK